MSGDETYLEAFLDSLAGLPNEIKRNMELMKDMDKTCSSLQRSMNQQQQEYIRQAESKVLALEVVKPPPSLPNGTDPPLQPGVRVNEQLPEVIIPTTEEMMEFIADHPGALAAIRELQGTTLQMADEKVAIANQTFALIDSVVRRLDADLECMEKTLQSTGDFQVAGAARPDDLAAVQVAAGSDWILAKVISHDPNTGLYKLSDEDVESNKIFNLPESQVVVLGTIEKLSKGDVVFAVYPDTTAFYQASVAQAPRKTAGTTTASFVTVNFVDDHDEHGIIPNRPVPIQHVMMPPYGATLQ
ncbi:Inhibitor of growth protein 4 [Seminavis robusta]|uniref:Inhibitor of growth protein 4 n=1 Tax=Seminavis robusta TaxID=568900 RepID=A0A9N8DNM3_9STRA|nr:Inhibitor of growth protein 4 [Seminavis robusta]|eukprot:Sro262_g102100.1 Inhibitor of growth protein 4 (300) ;mRNA; f:76802-78137